MDPDVTDLGLASPALRLKSFEALDDRVYVGTRGVTPTMLGVLDVDARRVERHVEVPTGDGVWSVHAFGGDVYLGTYDWATPADVYRYDADAGALERAFRFADEQVVLKLADADGTLFVGAYPSASVYECDPATGEVRDYGEVHDVEQYARGVAADDEHVYVGVGIGADLVELDRETGERRSILPAEFEDAPTLSTLALVDDWVVAPVGGDDPTLLLVSRSDPDTYRTAAPSGAEDVGFLRVGDGDVELTATVDGERRRYRYDPGDDAFEERESLPPDVGSVRRVDDRLVGITSGGAVRTHDLSSGEFVETDLVDAGMPTGGEVPFSMAVLDGVPVVAGHGALHVHDGADGPRQVPAPGEAKASIAVDGTLYTASYPDARLGRFELGDEEVTVLDRVGHEQNRTRDVCFHRPTRRLFVGTRPNYGELGGALSAYDPATGGLLVERDVVPDQSVCSLAPTDDTVYFGTEIYGEKVQPVAEEAVLGAWDPVADELRWTATPVDGASALVHLVELDGVLYGSAGGDLFAFDPETRETLRRRSVAGGFGLPGRQLLARGGDLFCATGDELLRIDPATLDSTTVLADLDPTNPMLAAHDGALYALRGPNLIRADGL